MSACQLHDATATQQVGLVIRLRVVPHYFVPHYTLRKLIVLCLPFSGVNLPQDVNEDKHAYLIEFFQNLLNHLRSSEDGRISELLNITTDVVRLLDSARARIYNPTVVRLLQIVKQHLQKPFVERVEFSLYDFLQLLQNALWEECAANLRTFHCANLYIDFNTNILGSDKLELLIEASSLHEVNAVKECIVTYITKVVRPVDEEATCTSSEDRVDESQTDTSEVTDNDKTKGKLNEGTLSPEVNETKRETKSVDRISGSLEPGRDCFTRSKSMPAPTPKPQRPNPDKSKSKRAKYNSESSDHTEEPGPVQELQLFKETLSLVLIKKLGFGSAHSPVDNSDFMNNG